jgi:hypothetical protein
MPYPKRDINGVFEAIRLRRKWMEENKKEASDGEARDV